jgi:hypothetical protein
MRDLSNEATDEPSEKWPVRQDVQGRDTEIGFPFSLSGKLFPTHI